MSSNDWTGKADVTQTDVAASFEAYLDAVARALVAAYPDATIDVHSTPGDLRDAVGIDFDPPHEYDHDLREDVELTISTVWEQGDFWVASPV